MSQSLRTRVLYLYKELLYMGKDYPYVESSRKKKKKANQNSQGYDYFRKKLHKAFDKGRNIKDPNEIEKRLEHGEYIKKELVALYTLRTYRSVKTRYYQ